MYSVAWNGFLYQYDPKHVIVLYFKLLSDGVSLNN